MSDRLLAIAAGKKRKLTCPPCDSEMVIVGRLVDSRGNPIQFAAVDRDGEAQPLAAVRSCYCNECGEVTLTLE